MTTLSLIFLASVALPSQGVGMTDGIVGARSLAISPDGKKLAFTYLGDVWVVPSEGGRAIPVTTHVEMDDNPVWSPDSKWIAFSTNRHGNNDTYIVSAEGGSSRRLTWFVSSETATDWSPDGKQLIFRSTRDGEYNGLFTINVADGKFKRLMMDPTSVNNACFSPDGKSVIYQRSGFDWVRPRYQGSAAAQLWQYNLESGKATEVRNNGFQHLWGRYNPDGKTAMLVTVGEKTPSSSNLNAKPEKFVDTVSRTPNIYKIDLSNGRISRLTDYVGGGVRFLSVAKDAGTVAFEYEGVVYTMTPGQKPARVRITASTDDKISFEERLVLTNGANQASLSPNGEKVVFSVRSELWSVPVKKGKGPNANDATQLTTWEGLDQNPLWAADNQTVFFTSDRAGSEQVYQLDSATRQVKAISEAGFDASGLSLSADKKKLFYWQMGNPGGLYEYDIQAGSSKKLMDAYATTIQNRYSWSPDGRYLAYVRSSNGTLINLLPGLNIHVLDTQTGTSTNVTRLNALNLSPKWSIDGKYLYFSSDREGTSSIYILPLQNEDARDGDLELKYTKPTETVKVDIDFNDINRRIRRLSNQSLSSDLYQNPENGDLFFTSGGDVFRLSYDGATLQRITTDATVSSIQPSADFSQLLLVRGGVIQLMNLRSPQYPVSNVDFRADWVRDLRLERRAAFAQFWRAFNGRFYDANMHGRDWAKIRSRYEYMLPSVGHRNEFATILNMMVGELESSHSEVSPAGGNPQSLSMAHPGFEIDYNHSGAGIKVGRVPRGVPASFAKTRINPGEFVLAINGVDATTTEAFLRDVFTEQIGREMTFLVNSSPSKTGAREVKYRAISPGQFGQVLYQNRIADRLKYVEEKSQGKVTYMHISGMGQNNFTTFNREAWEYISGKKAAIIDVRNNGGGNISDSLIDMIERRPHSIYWGRNDEPGLAPGFSWNIPTVVMHAETSFSNAEMFPAAMRASKLATLVGMPTPGYVIWTGGLFLVDGTPARMPGAGSYRLDGSPLENLGEVPDHQIPYTYEDYLAGKDPQLDKAIEILMQKVK